MKCRMHFSLPELRKLGRSYTSKAVFYFAKFVVKRLHGISIDALDVAALRAESGVAFVAPLDGHLLLEAAHAA